jgi:hypothetical protein
MRSEAPDLRLPPPVRTHLRRLIGPVGLYQHATGPTPDPGFGSCTDDVARAAMVDVAQARVRPTAETIASLRDHLAFLDAALDPAAPRFRNLRDISGAWDPAGDSDDAQARAIRGLADVATRAPSAALRAAAWSILERAAPVADSLRDLRPLAHVVLAGAGRAGGADETVPADRAELMAAMRDAALAKLVDLLPEPGDPWPWPEAIVTYENGVVPEALIAGGFAANDRGVLDRGLSLLDWLADAETAPAGHASTIGNAGWWPRGGMAARFDQQPIEAYSLLAAAARASEVTGDPQWGAVAARFFGWFLGDNDVGVSVARPWDGSCHDGLEPNGVNANQGAESTIVWLLSVEIMRRFGPGSTPGSGEGGD